MKLFTAAWILPEGQAPARDGGLLIDGDRILEVVTGRGSVARLSTASGASPEDLGAGVLCPGLVNAHAHLELTALEGRVSPQDGFAGWIGSLLAERGRAGEEALVQGLLRGADRLLATGTTCVGEISTLGLSAARATELGLRVRLYRESLDAGQPDRTAASLAQAEAELDRSPAGAGLSPHAPFSTSPALLEGLGALARRRGLPLTIHWAETSEEQQYLEQGTGPLVEHLGPSPRLPGLDLIEAAGLLGPRTSLVHGNWPAPGDPQRLARAGTCLVHCPGTHRFFGREPFPIEAYREAGVILALGTDSLASNGDLNMCSEMAYLRQASPQLASEEVWAMGTLGGAKALDMEGEVGVLAPGARADMVLFDVQSDQESQILDELTLASPSARRVWVGGEEASLSADAPGGSDR